MTRPLCALQGRFNLLRGRQFREPVVLASAAVAATCFAKSTRFASRSSRYSTSIYFSRLGVSALTTKVTSATAKKLSTRPQDEILPAIMNATLRNPPALFFFNPNSLAKSLIRLASNSCNRHFAVVTLQYPHQLSRVNLFCSS